MIVEKKISEYAHRQHFINTLALILFSLGTVVIATTTALFLLKSPLYGLLGLVPLLFYRQKSFYYWARELDKRLQAQGELVSSIQLAQIGEDNREGYAPDLIAAFIASNEKKFQSLNVHNFLEKEYLHRALSFLLITLVLALTYPAFFPERFYFALNHKIGYSVSPASKDFNRGENVDLMINFFGVYIPKKIILVYQSSTKVKRIPLPVIDNKGHIRLEVNEPFAYYFEFLNFRSERFSIGVLEPIYLKELSFILHYPKYTNLQEETKTERQLVAPRGTQVEIRGKASQTLKEAKFIFHDTINLFCNQDQFRGEFEISKSGTASLYIVGRGSHLEPITIYALPDLPPLVEIFYPGYNINVPPEMKLTLGIKCSDDYGLQRISLNYRLKEENQVELKFKKGCTEDTIYYDWDLNSLRMLPGDQLLYFVEVQDNAGQKTRSKRYYIYFPTVEQIYEEVRAKEDLVQGDLEEIKEIHQAGMQEISRLEDKLKRERTLSYLDNEKLKEIINKEENVLKKIEEWQKELQNTIEKLKSGVLLDPKSIERLQEITRILQEIAPEELKQALENLKQTLNRNPEELKKTMEQLREAQEELARALERTLELLKRYQQEEKLKELAAQAEKLATRAEELKIKEAEQGSKEFNQALDSLYQAIDSLAQEIARLARSLDLEPEIADQLREAARQAKGMSREQNYRLEDLKKGLSKLAADLQHMYEELTRGRMANLRKNLLESLNQIIELSKLEEELLRLEKIDPGQQADIIRATKTVAESLYAQQVKSVYVGPEIGKRLSRALKEMEMASLNPVNTGKIHAQEAMKQLNLAALSLLQSLKKAGEGSGSSTGMDEFLKNLSSLTQQQMGIGQSLFSIFPIPASGLTPEQMAQIQRLAGKQRELREALEALKGTPEAGRFQELLDNLTEEMKEIEEALYQYKIDRKMIERQQRIISRLLDAERSIRQEDWTKERKSRPGVDVKRPSPVLTPEELSKDELRELLQQALKQPYPEEYELYIREYFRALMEER
ncbi:MAG: hypothetical protein ABIL86_06510 [candidate division WOR-3 bacterium]